MADNQSTCKKQIEKLQRELQQERIQTKQLNAILNHDPDTGLLLRHMLVRRMNTLINGKVPPHFAFGIIRLDKNYQRIRRTRDRMKVLLFVTSERLKTLVGEENLYQSDRSDEFLFLIPNYKDKRDVEEKITEMIMKVSESHNPPASDVSFGCNVGVALFPDHASTLDELEYNAEIALGIHEEKSWNGFLYSPERGLKHHENHTLELTLRQSILNDFNGFHLAYQPIVNNNKEIIACEALLRWDVPGRGAVPPLRFIPLAEESGLINYLGKWVLYTALKQIKFWRKEFKKNIEVSVNVSTVQLDQDDFLDTIKTALKVIKVPPEALHLEVTESAVMDNPEDVILKLRELSKMGVEVMLDDFGTGYSSLSALNKLPIHTLKIPKEFVDNLPGNSNSLEVVRAILGIAKTFDFRTLAEGIEKQDQFDCLVSEGCQYIQGYITSPPVDAIEFQNHFLTPLKYEGMGDNSQ
ncbi:putative bifunctional diguanylate cyclase/phosphodiesterase [Oceanispirochaeta crateris]|nr:bifunctional diguanylate cyclase/phosphodiesterase [Oceanispirochaeta crateris]